MTATLRPGSSWRTAEFDLDTELEGKFGAALVKRAKKRVVVELGNDGQWAVAGDPALGDHYEEYRVTFDGRRYHCDCQGHGGGEYRRFCSHSLAVLIARKARKRNGKGVSGGLGSVPPHPQTPQPSTDPVPDVPAEHPGADSGDGQPAVVPSDGPVAEGEGAGPHAAGPLPLSTPDDPIWGAGELAWPEWVRSFRPHQLAAVEEIVEAFGRGDEVVWLDAPTGSGKSLLGEMVRRRLGVKALYVCSTKSLQEQFLADFPYAKVLKGRANYPTLDAPGKFPQLTAAECTRSKEFLPACGGCTHDSDVEVWHCHWCHGPRGTFDCPYQVAKTDARQAEIAVLNTAYWLAEANSAGTFRGWDLVIVDEADLLEQELMGYVEVRIGSRLQQELGIEPPEKKTVEESWATWLHEECVPKVKDALKKAAGKAQGADPAAIKAHLRLQRLAEKLRGLAKGLEDGGWIYSYSDRARDTEIVFKPVRVNELGAEVLWQHARRFLCMSATLIDPGELSESLGLAA